MIKCPSESDACSVLITKPPDKAVTPPFQAEMAGRMQADSVRAMGRAEGRERSKHDTEE